MTRNTQCQRPSVLRWALVLLLQGCGARVEDPAANLQSTNTAGATSVAATAPATGGYGASESTGGATNTDTRDYVPSGGSASVSECGNGRVEGAEECDDGNKIYGDGCDQYCRIDSADPCLGITCTFSVCGDMRVDGAEGCDDGNINSGDGCDGKCQVETGYICLIPGWSCQLVGVEPNCGNGLVDASAGETCDDGSFNGLPGYCPAYCELDTCSDDCDGSVSDGGCSSSCLLGPRCGDGVVNGPEQCDLGAANAPINAPQYGGCLSTCELGPHCGDGLKNGPEDCDYGDLGSPLDAPEYGSCLVNCTLGPHCGDGIVQGPEECDWGSLNRSDGKSCTPVCRVPVLFP